jgi:hypothetical protein
MVRDPALPNSPMQVIHPYRKPAITESGLMALQRICPSLESAESEFCYNAGVTEEPSAAEFETLTWLLKAQKSLKALTGS